MTNLSGTSSPLQKALTRQRLLVGAPLLFGVLIGAGLFAIFGLPDWLASNQRTLRIAELNSQKQSLPLIENQVRQAEQNLLAAQQQQDLVVSLVAGRGKIQTFLTQLSRASAESGVVIERYEPVSVATASTDSSENSTKSTDEGGSEKDKAALDLEGYEKSAVLLQVKGPYEGVHQFLREMEQLELLVQPSDLELTAVSSPVDDEVAAVGPALTELKLRLSFFDKSSEADQSKTAPTSTSQPPF